MADQKANLLINKKNRKQVSVKRKQEQSESLLTIVVRTDPLKDYN